MITRRRFLHSLGGFFALGASGGAYSFVIEPGFRLAVARWSVEHPHWPQSAPPLRIAVITDIHAVEPWMPASRIAKIAEAANALKPDLILLLGDYVSGLRSRYRTGLVPIADWSAALRDLQAPLGVHAVLGNHDWWVDADAVRQGLEGNGIPVLENDAVKLDHRGQAVWLAGLGDQMAYRAGRRRYQGVDDLPGTLAKISGDGDPAILMAHEPDIFVKVPERVTLTLSGHTHGGQVKLPFVGRPAVQTGHVKRYAYGHVVEDGRHIVVSAGLGLSIYPIRFMVPPEIALVTLTSPGGGQPV